MGGNRGVVETAKGLMREAVEYIILQSPTIKVRVDVSLCLLVLRKLKVDTDQFVSPTWGLALSEIAPEFGMKPIERDSRNSTQYECMNPRLGWCPRHRKVGRIVVVRERPQTWGLRVRHGRHSCRLFLIHEWVLVKALPRLIERDPMVRRVAFVTLSQGAQEPPMERAEEVRLA
jgi:hypothetical protein